MVLVVTRVLEELEDGVAEVDPLGVAEEEPESVVTPVVVAVVAVVAGTVVAVVGYSSGEPPVTEN